MRFNHLDILEHCFHEKFLGYNKKEVDDFLHLVSLHVRELEEEIQNLRTEIIHKDKALELLEMNQGRQSGKPGFPLRQGDLKKKAG